MPSVPYPEHFREFACRVCGADTDFSFCEPTAHPDLEHGKAHFQAWCATHCPGHDYEYDRYARDHFCRWCGATPDDPYFSEP